jgi:PLP dependent protein
MSGQDLLLVRHSNLMKQIRSAEAVAMRPANSVTLLAVSKTFPAADVITLAEHGQRAFGENYVQEGIDKIRQCADQRPDLPIEWHFIGPIQSNKTKLIAENFDWVHSIEREKIAQRLSDQRPPDRPALQVCIQINVSGEATKSGCPPSDALALAVTIAKQPNLRLRGVMCVPEATTDEVALRQQFSVARQVFDQLNTAGLKVDTLSMGMSADLAVAVAEGATIVRVGSAIFGQR